MVPVFKCAVLSRDERGGYANAVLIDKDRGIFATNAHVVNAYQAHRTNKVFIQLPHTEKLHRAETNPKWINWDADLAYIRLEKDLSGYPQAILRRGKGEYREKMRCTGYYLGEDPPVTTDGHVVEWKTNLGVTMPMLTEMWAAQDKWFLGNEERHMLYQDYIYVWMKENTLKPSMSGSPLLDKEGRIAGMLCRAGHHSSLFIPASEINFDYSLDKPALSLSGLFNRLGLGQKTAAPAPSDTPKIKPPQP